MTMMIFSSSSTGRHKRRCFNNHRHKPPPLLIHQVLLVLVMAVLLPKQQLLLHRDNSSPNHAYIGQVVAAATMFSIAGASFSGDWDTTNAATNTVTITFDEQGESATEFNINIDATCSDAAVSATSGDGTDTDSNDQNVVFTNQQELTTQTTACMDVTLYVDGITASVATRRVSYVIDPTQNGSGNVQVTNANLDGVEANAQTAQSVTGIVGTHSLSFTANVVGVATINYGETFDIEVDAITGYDIDVTAISVGTITAEPGGTGYISAPSKKTITVLLPLSSFLDSEGGSETIDLTLAWKVTGSRRTLLRQRRRKRNEDKNGGTDNLWTNSNPDLEDAQQEQEQSKRQQVGQLGPKEDGGLLRRRWPSFFSGGGGGPSFDGIVYVDDDQESGTATVTGVKVNIVLISSASLGIGQ